MKKLLLLLLIAPIIGNSQDLNLPITDVKLYSANKLYQMIPIPEGKVWQIKKMYGNWYFSIFQTTDPSYIYPDFRIYSQDWNGTMSDVYGDTAEYLNASADLLITGGNYIQSPFNGSDQWFSYIEYDLNAQNLASNVPQQTTPTLYPNPTSSLLALNSDKEYDIEVYDMTGNKVMALTGNIIDMSHLSSATYIVKALDKVENEEVSYKFVKN